MATFYVDFENGNDNHAGTSFDPISGTDGRISGSTFTSASANFTSTLSSLISQYGNQYLSIFTGAGYSVFAISTIVGSTSLTITAIPGGAALANQSVDRQYFIGGRWRTFNTGATAARIQPGDSFRVEASPSPQSLGINATWTSANLSPTVNISSSTNATPISVTATNHGYSTGTTVVITGHTINTNANGTWEITVTGTNTFTLNGSTGNGVGAVSGTVRNRNNGVVRLASALTQNIASCGNRGQGRVSWTTADAVNVTTSLNTASFKEGDCSDSIAIGAGFTTGKAAYFPTGSLNLSGYQQVSFWIIQTAGTVAVSGDISLALCSDTLGNTPVHTIPIENLVVLTGWLIITYDFGINLDSNIQSIALYVNVDRGAQTFILSNIIACKASSSNDSLNLASLISKNKLTLSPSSIGSFNEPWLCIQSINGTRVMLEGTPGSIPTTPPRGYSGGASETVETFKRETVKIPIANTTNGLVLNEAGTAGNTIDISGGWDRTNMTSIVGSTYLDGRLSWASAVTSNRAYINISNFAFVRFSIGFDAGANCVYNIDEINNCNTVFQGSATATVLSTINLGNACFNANVIGTLGPNNSFLISGLTAGNTNLIPRIWNKNTYQFAYSINNFTTINMGNAPLGNNYVINTYSDDGLAFYNSYGLNNNASNCTFHSVDAQAGDLYLYNTTLTSATEATMGLAFSDSRVYSHNHDGIPGNHVIFTDGGRISSNTSVRYTDSGFSWALAPTSNNRSSSYPLYLKIATAAVSANNLVTIKAWMRRTNTALTMRLRVPEPYNITQENNNLPDINYDFMSYITANANAWEQVSLSFTPGTDRIINIYVDAYGGTTNTGYVDDLTINQ